MRRNTVWAVSAVLLLAACSSSGSKSSPTSSAPPTSAPVTTSAPTTTDVPVTAQSTSTTATPTTVTNGCPPASGSTAPFQTPPDHELEHAEISATPDYSETFPPHCMRGTHGAEKIPETTLLSPMVIEPVAIAHETLVRQLSSHAGDVLIRKHRFDVFSNPNTRSVIEAWDPTVIVIYGVTLDYCVKYAIDGMIDVGIPTIHLVLDATRPIVPEAVDALVSGWKKQDVRIVTTGDVVCGRIE